MRTIISFSLPYLLAYFMQVLYGMVDIYVAGLYCDVDTITAVSIGSQVMHLLTVLIVGLTVGTTVTVAQSVGSGNEARVRSAIGNTITALHSAWPPDGRCAHLLRR